MKLLNCQKKKLSVFFKFLSYEAYAIMERLKYVKINNENKKYIIFINPKSSLITFKNIKLQIPLSDKLLKNIKNH